MLIVATKVEAKLLVEQSVMRSLCLDGVVVAIAQTYLSALIVKRRIVIHINHTTNRVASI